MLAAILAVDAWMAPRIYLDVVAGGALLEIAQFSFEAGLEIDFAFVDGAGEGFDSSRGSLHLPAKPLDLLSGLVAIVLQLVVERGLNGLQLAGPRVRPQLVPERLQLGAKIGGLSGIQLDGVLFGGAERLRVAIEAAAM